MLSLHVCLGTVSQPLPSQCTWETRWTVKTVGTLYLTYMCILHTCMYSTFYILYPPTHTLTHMHTLYPIHRNILQHTCVLSMQNYSPFPHTFLSHPQDVVWEESPPFFKVLTDFHSFQKESEAAVMTADLRKGGGHETLGRKGSHG